MKENERKSEKIIILNIDRNQKSVLIKQVFTKLCKMFSCIDTRHFFLNFLTDDRGFIEKS